MKQVFTKPNERDWRFQIGWLGIVAFFLVLLVGVRMLFLGYNWEAIQAAGGSLLARALLKGLRFDVGAMGCLMVPALILYFLLGATGWRWLRVLLLAGLTALAVSLPVLGVIDLQYFEESGTHLTYEVTAHLNWSSLPVVLGGFAVHPWLCSGALLGGLGLGALSWRWFRRLLQLGMPAPGRWLHWTQWATLPLWIILLFAAMRDRSLHIGHSCISSNPYVNGLCLNPVYAVLRSSLRPFRLEYRFNDEAFNIATTRELLLGDPTEGLRQDYPLLRTSPGTPTGNRKNVVLFILESWTGKDVGALGGPPGVTPFFDALSKQGALFDRFYATGLRTPEGIFSILCSFPNQPTLPIMNQPNVFNVSWRSLSQILDEVGYQNLFIHGRDLDFDHMKDFLKAMGFHQFVDKNNFPPTVKRARGAWIGYDDRAVMRRAHEMFLKQGERPFLGAIYTLDTHPPFNVPDDFPPLFKPDSISNLFLNALHYSDSSLQLFFDLARTAPYFKDTIFVFVADHSRTRDTFNFDSQHRIPLLIYAPGHVAPGVRHILGSQLDIMPTLLGLLDLKTSHASWGQDLLRTPEHRGFAVSVSGQDVRWHYDRFLLNDSLTTHHPLLFDLRTDPNCQTNVWAKFPDVGPALQTKLRAYLSLSQSLFSQNRVYARPALKDNGRK